MDALFLYPIARLQLQKKKKNVTQQFFLYIATFRDSECLR